MGITVSRADVLSNHVDFKIKYQKRWRISNELKEIKKNAVFKNRGGGKVDDTGLEPVTFTMSM